MKLPKFHTRPSLITGTVAGIILGSTGWITLEDGRWLSGLYQIAVGLVLAIHCLDMLRIYKKHRIVKIMKIEDVRLVVVKSNDKTKVSG